MAPPTYTEQDSQLITDLYTLFKKAPKLCKASVYPAPADPEIKVSSWKMNEFKYYDVPSPFPTLARGIFTVELPNDGPAPATMTAKELANAIEQEKKYRIVARGYDKFFNIGEVPWVTVSSSIHPHASSTDHIPRVIAVASP